jgi:hypothetical protein
LRFVAGVASAFVLVGTSAWAMPILRARGKEDWSGHVFSGVGIGIAFAGLFGLAAAVDSWSSGATWIVLGVVAVGLSVVLWRPLSAEPSPATVSREQAPRALPRPTIIAAFCYAAFGFGYIIPATFLPALAKGYIDNPMMFGLIWPVFGAAAALSTFASGWLGRGLAPWQLWTRAKWVLAAGVAAPALWVNVPTLLLSAVCVGGTFHDHHHGRHQGGLAAGRRARFAGGRRDDGRVRRGPDRGPLDGESARPLGARLCAGEPGCGRKPYRRQLRAAAHERPRGDGEGLRL